MWLPQRRAARLTAVMLMLATLHPFDAFHSGEETARLLILQILEGRHGSLESQHESVRRSSSCKIGRPKKKIARGSQKFLVAEGVSDLRLLLKATGAEYANDCPGAALTPRGCSGAATEMSELAVRKRRVLSLVGRKGVSWTSCRNSCCRPSQFAVSTNRRPSGSHHLEPCSGLASSETARSRFEQGWCKKMPTGCGSRAK